MNRLTITSLKCILTLIVLPMMLSTFAQERREVGNMVLEDVPEIPKDISSRLQQYQNTRTASFVDWLPNDKGMLIATRFGNTTQLHTVEVPGAAREQITFFDEPVSNGTYSEMPDYNGFIFTKDIGGNEFSQLFWYDMDKRSSTMLSDGESVNFGANYSNKGNRFAFTSTRRNTKDFDVYVSSMSNPEKADLKVDRGEGYWMTADWSPDDSKLLLMQYLSSTKSNGFVYDMDTDTLEPLNDEKEEAVFMGLSYNATGDKIYVISDKGREFQTLALLDVASGNMSYITDAIPWDIETFSTNKQRTRAAFVSNENGYGQLYLMNLEDNSYKKVENLPVGQISGIKFHPSKELLAMTLNTTETPGDTYTLDVATSKVARWTNSEVGGLDTGKFPKPELIYYETFDKDIDGNTRKIPAFVFKPNNGKGPFATLIMIHGGPEGQYTPRFSSFTAYLANELGVAIIAPNVRGSSGYGKSYLKLDNGFNREDSVKDIGKLMEWIENQSEFDNDRIGVYGGSYGGYMVLSSMFNYNDRLKCGVDIVGISNFVTFLENTQEYRRDLRRAEYGDERKPKMREHLLAISPTSHVKEITKPLFVIQGANDPRVPASESEQMVNSIRENQGKVWYMLAKDEGHGFRKKDNRDRMTEAIALFLKENLLK